MIRPLTHLLFAAVLFASVISSESHSSDLLKITEDGWYTWYVDTDDGLQIYSLIDSGRPTRVVVPAYDCGWKAVADATDLGAIDAAESIAWLRRFIAPRSDISSEVMAALSAHANEDAADALGQVLRSDSSRRNRKEALFWLAQTNADAAFDILDRLLSSGG